MSSQPEQPQAQPIEFAAPCNLGTGDILGLLVAFCVVAYFLAYWIG